MYKSHPVWEYLTGWLFFVLMLVRMLCLTLFSMRLYTQCPSGECGRQWRRVPQVWP